MVTSILVGIIIIILAPMAAIVINALALPVVMFLVRAWTSMYATLAPAREAEARQLGTLSDVDAIARASQASGYRPPQVAVHIFLSLPRRFWNDLVWFAPYLPAMLARRLMQGGHGLNKVRPPTRLISSSATLCLINWCLYASDNNLSGTGFFLINCGLVAMLAVMWNQKRHWARRFLGMYLGLTALVAGGFIVWVVVHRRLYQEPLFMEHVLALVPLLLAFVVATRECRSRVFRNHWWPVLASWAVIAATSVGSAMLTESLAPLLTVWAMAAVFVGSLAILCGIAAAAALSVWYVSAKVSAHGMRLVAASILRLQS